MIGRPLNDAQRELAGNPRHIAYARFLASRFAAKAPHLADEFESAAMLGLVEAARSYRAGRGVKFVTHARAWILGRMRDAGRMSVPQGFRRRGKSAPIVESIFAPAMAEGDVVRGDVGHVLTHQDLLDSGEGPVGWEEESIDAVRGMLSELPFKFRRVMAVAYTHAAKGKGRAPQTARLLGLCAKHAAQVHREGLEMLRRTAAERRTA